MLTMVRDQGGPCRMCQSPDQRYVKSKYRTPARSTFCQLTSCELTRIPSSNKLKHKLILLKWLLLAIIRLHKLFWIGYLWEFFKQVSKNILKLNATLLDHVSVRWMVKSNFERYIVYVLVCINNCLNLVGKHVND